ncbi:MAG: orotidine 5'-phosphate decarboxylase [Candidatus Aenigmarchaeota archaeon]|nr:orotidine 5'-phosphate decarboxylase [Candidatus Aenigmarchaeota archaeon]
MRIIEYDRSIIPACDVETLQELKKLVEQTHDVKGIGGYKIGFVLALNYGLPNVVKTIRKFTHLPIIYDHQKAATDVPDMGQKFAKVCKDAGVDAVILFPQSGPATEEAWIKACQDVGSEVIVGGEMTHPKFKRSEGGFIDDDALDEIYLNATNLGVTNFVVPGNRVDRILHYKSILETKVKELTFFAPGFVAQGGEITEAAKAAGKFWHAIVGRAIYQAKDMRKAAEEMTCQLF